MKTRVHHQWGNLTWRDVHLGPDEGKSLWQYCPPNHMSDPHFHVFMEDFGNLPSVAAPIKWILTEDGGKTGPDALLDAKGGQFQFFCDGDNEDEAYLEAAAENFLVEAGKPIWFEARFYMIESNLAGNTANFIVGLAEAPGADFLQDAGAGPPAAYDGFVWYKRDANMYLEFESSNAGAQVTKTNIHAVVAGGGWHRVGFMVYTIKTSDTVAVVYPFLDGEILTAKACSVTIAALGEMKPVFGLKNGSAAGGLEEYMTMDFIKAVQVR
jgi:hypothetical protein